MIVLVLGCTVDAVFYLRRSSPASCDLHNLFPLLVHMGLIGGGYAGQVETILRRFGL